MTEEEETLSVVVVNEEEQYSVWPADRSLPLGRREAGKRGRKAECLDHIEEVWTDMRPLSLQRLQQKQMGIAAIAWPEPGRDGRFAPAEVAEPLPAPADECVRLWRIVLDRNPDDVARLSAMLDSEQRARAARHLHDRDRARYVVGCAAMRILLAAQGDLAPEALRFRTGTRGKPELCSGGCHFNLSRSGGMAMLAIGPDPLGIDIERLRAIPEMEQIAEQFFSGPEVAWLRAASEAARSYRFLRLWTRKEALVKADGRGIAEDLRMLDLVPGEGSGVADVAVWGRRWRIHDLSAGPHHVAALALVRELPR